MSDDANSGPEPLSPKAEHYVGASIQGIWLQRSVESASTIVTAIHVQSEPLGNQCELQLLTLQLFDVEVAATFKPMASIELTEFFLWLLEGDFVIFVDGSMNVKIWNWKSGAWGLIKDPTNEVLNVPVCFSYFKPFITSTKDVAEFLL